MFTNHYNNRVFHLILLQNSYQYEPPLVSSPAPEKTSTVSNVTTIGDSLLDSCKEQLSQITSNGNRDELNNFLLEKDFSTQRSFNDQGRLPQQERERHLHQLQSMSNYLAEQTGNNYPTAIGSKIGLDGKNWKYFFKERLSFQYFDYIFSLKFICLF